MNNLRTNVLRFLLASGVIAAIAADALLAFTFISAKPSSKGHLHQWDVPSFWLPLTVCAGLGVLIGTMFWVSHHKSGYKRGAIIGSIIVAALFMAAKVLMPTNITITSFISGGGVMTLIVGAYLILLCGGRLAKRWNLFG